MLVEDLIKILGGFNPKAEISLVDSESIYVSYICEDDATPLTTGHVFLEGCDLCRDCEFFDDGFCGVYDKFCDDVDECFQFVERDE